MLLQKIKTLLGISDNLQDPTIVIIIDNVTSHLQGLLKKEVPKSLEYIVVEISIRRFNRIGTEGMKSETVEGHKIDFYDLKDEFTPYWEVIEGEKDIVVEEPKRGRVMFI